MKIGNREISPSHPPLVIAEIGINHGGDLEVAKNMVRLAALSGCECVKHQTHIVEDEMTDEAKQIFHRMRMCPFGMSWHNARYRARMKPN